VAEKAREALPEANGRIDSAVKIVLAGDVELLDGGSSAKVASRSNGTTEYFVTNGGCQCKDFPKAPGNFCSHRLAYGLMKRGTALAKQRVAAQSEGSSPASVAPIAPEPLAAVPPALPEAPASANVYVTIAGRKVQLTLRDHDENSLLARMEQLLSRFPEEEPESSIPPEGWCPIHQCQMKHNTKNHKSWWSHRLPNGTWCHGK
jgi:hypothetical protein